MPSCLIGTGSECLNNLFNLVIREIFSSVYVINGERDCGFIDVDVVAVVNSLTRKLTLETSPFDSLYGGQFTLSTQLIKPHYVVAVVSLFVFCFLYMQLPFFR